ncbi:MAG: hypothetical protein A3A73_01005 [Omnitrophica bacterium RIFCSPLOWO2_01_FULL_50_24]|nr:MAG: hypothetical protein A3A73_01005 [Omnitrophica bacterium RIFCSPLOWO2_01_FULL_50_24]
MCRRAVFAFLFYLVFLSPSFASEAEEVRAPVFHELSPVYEEMLANEIAAFRFERVTEKAARATEPFTVTGWDSEAKQLALEVMFHLQRRPRSAVRTSAQTALTLSEKNVEFFPKSTPRIGASDQTVQHQNGVFHHRPFAYDEHEENSYGILLAVVNSQTFEEALQSFRQGSRDDFLILLPRDGLDFETIQSSVRAIRLTIHATITEPELEYVKDKTGRQLLNLDWSAPRERIYERYVYEGMNPVYAWPEVDQAIQKFRSSDKIAAVVVRRN